ncbi:MAG: VWA domain-containing protein [Rhodothermia bacterium]
MYRPIAAVSLFALFALTGFTPSVGQTNQPANDLVIILDASGSMWGQIEGENKIVIARRVLKDLTASLPEDTNVGLVAYGHRREGDCNDIETVIPLGSLDRDAFAATVDGINPKGKTPITKSIEETFSTLQSHDSPVTVILVSDGLETCSGDPCTAVREARESGIELLMHVGQRSRDDPVAQLRQITA